MTYKQAYQAATADDTPTLWRDMTPEEKGALLLAHHEGAVIEAYGPGTMRKWVVMTMGPNWLDSHAYRIKPSKPEPKVETRKVYTGNVRGEWGPWHDEDDTHRITFSLIDGKPDCDSVKMEEL